MINFRSLALTPCDPPQHRGVGTPTLNLRFSKISRWIFSPVRSCGFRKGRYPHPRTRLPPSFSSGSCNFSVALRRQQGGTPHSRTRVGTPTPSDQVTPLTPPRGLEYNDPHPPQLAHEGVPPPCSGFQSPTEAPSRHPPFRVQNEGVPPLWCHEVPPHPIKVRDPIRPPQGVRVSWTPSPLSWCAGGGTTLSSKRGVHAHPSPPFLTLAGQQFSAKITSQ